MTVVDPLEAAAELAAWNDFVAQIEATIPFADSTSADTNITYTPSPPINGATAPGAGLPTISEQVSFVAPWEGQLGTEVTDPVTGITVPLDLQGSPVSPAFEDPLTHRWTINPAYVAWAVAMEQAHSKPNITSVPAPDPPQTFQGTGPYASWGDVYLWAKQQAATENAPMTSLATVNGQVVARSVEVAMGTVIKALSGFISQVAQSVADLSATVRTRIDALQLATYVAVVNLANRVEKLEAVQNLILKLAIPSLQFQISAEKHNRQVEIVRNRDAERVYARETIYNPLHTQIIQAEERATQQANAVHAGVPAQVEALFPQLIAPLAATVAGLATKVGTLETEAANCGRPMCATMGPNTNLGKFLKALSLLADAAIIADLLSLTEPELVAKLGEAIQKFAGLVGDAEGFFTSGTETIGQLITGLGATGP